MLHKFSKARVPSFPTKLGSIIYYLEPKYQTFTVFYAYNLFKKTPTTLILSRMGRVSLHYAFLRVGSAPDDVQPYAQKKFKQRFFKSLVFINF